MGRPRVKGQQLASPHAVGAHTATRTRLRGTWDGGTTRDLEIIPGAGHWDRLGAALGEVRWVDVQDGTGTHRDDYCLTTDRRLCPKRIVEC